MLLLGLSVCHGRLLPLPPWRATSAGSGEAHPSALHTAKAFPQPPQLPCLLMPLHLLGDLNRHKADAEPPSPPAAPALLLCLCHHCPTPSTWPRPHERPWGERCRNLPRVARCSSTRVSEALAASCLEDVLAWQHQVRDVDGVTLLQAGGNMVPRLLQSPWLAG